MTCLSARDVHNKHVTAMREIFSFFSRASESALTAVKRIRERKTFENDGRRPPREV